MTSFSPKSPAFYLGTSNYSGVPKPLEDTNQEQEGVVYTNHSGDEQRQNQQHEELDLNATAKMRGSSTEHQMHGSSSEIKTHVHSSESQTLRYNKESTQAQGEQSTQEAQTFHPPKFGASIYSLNSRDHNGYVKGRSAFPSGTSSKPYLISCIRRIPESLFGEALLVHDFLFT
ncbi:hypothetical protein PIB30_076388 [Stylosanthes scabra]|uniref:Uncharacterized protein n=1 Tax=Stylosanthes scabra TaxID=79078 RepID=A0ABU6VQ10_9FABA|nr:hypothetical protein [Stylosanthes scabra]